MVHTSNKSVDNESKRTYENGKRAFEASEASFKLRIAKRRKFVLPEPTTHGIINFTTDLRLADFVAVRGDAYANVTHGKAAIAMAKSSKGAAYAYTDGRHHYFDAVGNGVAAVGGGVAYAGSGSKNKAMAYSSKAARASKLEWEKGGKSRKAIKY